MCYIDKEEVLQRLEIVNTELDNIVKHKTAGAYVRSRSQWYEEGEKNNKYFLSLEKNQCSNKTIKYLLTDKGEVFGINKILEEEKNILKNYILIMMT